MTDSHDRKFLLASAAALALVLTVLVSTVFSTGTDAPRSSDADGFRDGEGHSQTVTGRHVAAPEREVCEDGDDPAASLRPDGGSGEAVKRITDRGQLIVGVDQNSYRWSYRDPQTGDLEGFDIDLVETIAEDLLGPRARIVYKTIPTDQRIKAVQDNDVDMVVRTMTANCERVDDVAFSTSYFEAGQQVLVPSRSRISGYNSSVKDATLCTAKGSTGETELAKKEFDAKVVTVPNQLDCLVRLQLGQVDAVVTDNALAAGQAAQDPSVRLVGEPFTIEPYGVAMNQDDEDLVRRVNKVLNDFRKGGKSSAWREAYDEWLGDVLKEKAPSAPEPIYRD